MARPKTSKTVLVRIRESAMAILKIIADKEGLSLTQALDMIIADRYCIMEDQLYGILKRVQTERGLTEDQLFTWVKGVYKLSKDL